ncbi:MAG TPA: glutamate-1-semialdehyde 2,1-aminomutase [Syntrophales bacterium]|nr:glutamate-1-semialdehyde 2,1-aminomutase [Syntrophales bacterium]
MTETLSERLFSEAKNLIPGGVNSPVRAFGAVGGNPVFIAGGRGSRIYDVDGREYVDYILSWGPLILGHGHPAVQGALTEQVSRGVTFGAPTALEVDLARLVLDAFPAMDKVRFVNSGTEAVMTALRLARAYTKRDVIVKFEGCYHGHGDSLLAKAGSGIATYGIPGSPGVPAPLAALTITVPYNDLGACEAFLKARGEEVAAVIVEPVAGNMGVVPPAKGFLQGLRELCTRHGIVLIFDEVITGFRLTYGGYQGLVGVEPDLTCLGKIIGGGLPVGAFGGKEKIMDLLAPTGPVYQAGTLSGNPLAMAAGIATLSVLKDNAPFYEVLDRAAFSLCTDIEAVFAETGVPVVINRVGSMFTPFFTSGRVNDYGDAARSDTAAFARLFKRLLERGVMAPPSQFEAWFLSFAHTAEDRDRTIEALRGFDPYGDRS